MKLFKALAASACFLVVAFFGSGCDRGLGKAIKVSSQIDPNLVFKDEIHFINDSDLIALDVSAKLKLQYATTHQEVNVAWARWEPGEKKTVQIPAGLNGLQKYHLVGRIGVAGKDGSPNYSYQAVDSSWTAN